MRIAITGSTGLVGSALEATLATTGYEVLRIVRSARYARPGDIAWDPQTGVIQVESLETVDAVVHLAGENIASGRWTAARKARILESRVRGTRLIAETLAELKNPPDVLICASAIGYYGDRGEELLTEETPPGTGFLPEVCCQWESAADPAARSGIRTCHLRLGIVLSPQGGALKKMLLPFRMGFGGRLGDGRQYMSWVTLDDVVGAILHVLPRDEMHGAINVVAPSAVTNSQFTQALSKALGRPALLPVPAFALRLALGEMAQELLLASIRAAPQRLLDSGYRFQHANLEDALKSVLNT